jgi:four helix bundle protein
MKKANRNLAARTKRFALEIIQLYSALPKSTVAQVLGRQLLRSGTSVGAHYREANRAKSNADFISKVEGAPRNWMRHPTGSIFFVSQG